MAQPTLMVTKTDHRETVVPGTLQSYEITVTNEGPGDLEDVRVIDVLVDDLLDTTWSCSAEEGEDFSSILSLIETEGVEEASSLVVSPGGQHVYVASLSGDGIAIFARDPEAEDSDHLELLEFVDATDGPSALAVSSDGLHVYVTGVNDHSLMVFDRDTKNGQLTLRQRLQDNTNGVDGLRGAAGIAFDPSGDHVYVTARHEAAVAVFERDSETGELSFLEVELNGVDDVTGLVGATGIAVSPDGAHVIVTGRFEDTLVVFERQPEILEGGTPNSNYGKLQYLETLRQGVAGAAGIDEPVDLDISPDGAHVYVAAAETGGLSVYRRNGDAESPAFGLLSFQQLLADGAGEIEGLAGARSVVVSPDGRQVYAVGETDDALVTFSRNEEPTSPDYGRLSFLEMRLDGVDGVDGIAQPYAVAASDDGSSAYVAGFGDDAVAAFQRRVSSRCTTRGQGDIDHRVDIAQGGTLTYELTGRIDSDAEGTLTNTVQVRVTEETVIEATDTSALTPEFDLTVTHSNGLDQVVAGEPLVYTLRVANAGPSEARDVPVEVLLDPAFFAPEVKWTCSVGGAGGLAQPLAAAEDDDCSPSSGQGDVASQVRIAAGGEVVFTIEAQVLPSVVGTPCTFDIGQLCIASTATALSDSDPQPEDNTFTDEDLIARISDLEIRKEHTVVGTEVAAGEEVGYVITVTNHGPSDVQGAEVRDVFPVLFDSVEWSCTASGQNTSCDGHSQGQGDIEATVDIGAGSSVRFEATASLASDASAGGLENQASVGMPDGTVDPDLANNTDTAGGLNIVQRAELTVTKTYLGSEAPVAGAEIGYRILVENAGPSDAPNTFVEDLFSEAIRDVVWQCDAEPSEASCTANGQGQIREWVDIPAGGRVTFTATGTLVPSALGALENVARVVGDAAIAENDLSDNSSSVVVEIIQVSELVLSKDLCAREPASGDLICPGAQRVVAGEDVEFAITAKNNGPSEASFTLVDELDLYDAEAGSGVFVPGSISWQCEIDPALERIGLHQDVDGGGLGDGLAGVADVALSPDGAHVLIASPGDDAVAVFSRQPDGGLSWQQVLVGGLAGAEGLAISPDGRHVYVASAGDDAVVLLSRESDPQSSDFGDLSFVEAVFDSDPGIDGLAGAARILLSRDGAFVYVTGEDDDAVSVFARDPESGLLSLVERERSGLDGVPFQVLDGAHALALSQDPEQSRLYVGAQRADAIAIFERDPAAGELSFLEVVRNGDVHEDASGPRTVQGLEFVRDLAFSPQGSHLYAAGLEGDALIVFRVGSVDDCGERPAPCLLFEQQLPNLDGLSAVEVSADGLQVYGAVRNGSALAVFRRDAQSGALQLRETVTDPVLEGVRALASTVGGIVYAGAELADTLTAWRPLPETSCSGGAADRLVEEIFLEPGAEVTFQLRGRVDAGAEGMLVNTAIADLDGDELAEFTSPTFEAMIYREADLQITKSDGMTDVRVGDPVTYTITVSNPGPSDIPGARVMDPPNGLNPAALNDAQWTCSAVEGARCGAESGVFPFDEFVDLPAGSHVTYTLSGTVAPTDASNLVNIASVDVPKDAIEREPADNQATDTNNLVAFVDLAITKSNGVAQVVPGEEVTYNLVVSNLASGMATAATAIVRDVVPSILQDVTWTCTAEGGADCGPNIAGSGSLDERGTLPVGSVLRYAVRGVVDSTATGNLVNTATVTPGAPLTDPNSGNDAATDVDPLTPETDLEVELFASGCRSLTYTATVRNTGPSEARGLVLEASLPKGARLVAMEGCATEPASGEAICDLGTLAVEEAREVTLFVATTVDDPQEVFVEITSDTFETDPGDNTAGTDVFEGGCIFSDDFESGDLAAWTLPEKLHLPSYFEVPLTKGAWRDQAVGDVEALRVALRLGSSGLFLAEGWHLPLFVGLSGAEQPLFGVEIGRFGDVLKVLAWAGGEKDGHTSGWSPLPAGDPQLELEWWVEDSTSNEAQGGLRLWLDGVLVAELLSIDNTGQQCRTLRFGSNSALTPSSGRGSYQVHDFAWQSRRFSP